MKASAKMPPLLRKEQSDDIMILKVIMTIEYIQLVIPSGVNDG